MQYNVNVVIVYLPSITPDFVDEAVLYLDALSSCRDTPPLNDVEAEVNNGHSEKVVIVKSYDKPKDVPSTHVTSK